MLKKPMKLPLIRVNLKFLSHSSFFDPICIYFCQKILLYPCETYPIKAYAFMREGSGSG